MILDPPLPPPPATPSVSLMPPPPSSLPPTDSQDTIPTPPDEPAPRQASPPASPVRILAAPLPPSPSSPRSIIGTSSLSPRSGVPGILHLTPTTKTIPPTAAPPPPSVLQQAQPSPSAPPPSSPSPLIPPTPPQQVNGLPPQNGNTNGMPALLDSITLGQLKAAAVVAKPKPTQYDFRYEDSDTLMSELQEFFSYDDVLHLDRALLAFQSSHDEDQGDWTKRTPYQKAAFVEAELEKMKEGRDVDAALKLTYILQGTFAETTSPEHQLHLIIENSRIVRQAGGLAILIDCLKDASKRHDASVSFTDHLRRDSHASTSEHKVDLGSVREEISLYLGMIYFIVEVSRGDDDLAKELMAAPEPLVVYLMQMIGNLKDRQQSRHPEGYPTKRLILLTWKVLLACLGGLRDAHKVAKLSREMAGLSPVKEDWFGFTKASPSDIRQFRQETSVKYPTFAPKTFTDGVSISAEKLAEALSPIPVRPHYHAPPTSSLAEENFTSLVGRSYDYQFVGGGQPQPSINGGNGNGALPSTPAPSPPPSPKPKKQMWQTDPARPFVFPFSTSAHGVDTMVPYAIDEADKLYKQHAHVSLGLYQLWKEREEFLKEEIGLGSTGILGLGVPNESGSKVDGEEAVEEDQELGGGDEILREYKEKDKEFRKKEEEATREGNLKEVRGIREKRESLKKLERVEMIYRGLIPSALPAAVVVLLKLVFDSVPQPPAAPAPPNPAYPGAAVASPGAHEADFEFPEDLPALTLEEVDVIREREIAWKGVSAIILLMLKWFKCSHILKFQHLSQLLVTMNCPVVMVKTFQYPEPIEIVKAKTDLAEKNFFRYCHVNLSRYPQKDRPEDSLAIPTTRLGTRAGFGGGAGNKHPGTSTDEEVELISEYSWRNFFSAINRTKIIQKLLKGRSEKIYQFNQHKPFNTFKRMLKVPHPMFQLQVLKVIKSQIPHYGKKWKQQNMKIVTAIYLNCRPDLRDEWLTVGMEAEELVESSLQEHALKSLVRFYHSKHYPHQITNETYGTLNAHRRSHSANGPSHMNGGFPSSPASHHLRNASSSSNLSASSPLSPGDNDLFPPNRSHPPSSLLGSPRHSSFPDELMDSWQHEYEDVLDDVFGTSDDGEGVRGGGMYGSDWGPLSSALNGLDLNGHGRWHFNEGDDGYDSEVSSIGTMGELGEDARLGEDRERESEEGDDDEEGDDGEPGEDEDFSRGESEGKDEEEDGKVDENTNNWEHMSQTTLQAMPRSPTGIRRRSSSGGSPLRPVMQGNGVDGPQSDEMVLEDEEEMGPVPKGPGGMGGGGVDEVEFLFGI
ncbi:hypothetical protein BDY24DRAFT_394393 [Mrakia frigida]|uniref:Far11p n=1 Tax=Mrakia frigida TaxID=29902 RepID=UPI003FCBFA4E